MSSQVQKRRLLTGSLNLLPPVDKVAAPDAIALENWRPDQQGSLVSRAGIQPFSQIPGGGYCHTIARRGTVYYYGAENSLYRGDQSQVTGNGDGAPFGVVSYQGFAWIMNRGVQGKDDGISFAQWGIVAPSSAITATVDIPAPDGLTGTYRYYVTYLDENENESNPSPASQPVSPSGQYVALSDIPISPDSQVKQRNIYRSGGQLGQGYLVLTINDNKDTGSGSYIPHLDSLSDADATTKGIALEVNHDGPPPAKGVAGPYFSRLLAWSSVEHRNRMWWTKVNEPGFWPGAQGEAAGQWVDVGDDAEEIVRVVLHARMAVIYKERSIWRLIGDPDTGFLEQTSSKVGLVAYNGVTNVGAEDYFQASDGIYRFNLDNAVKVSQKLDPLFQGRYVQLASNISANPINTGSRDRSAMEYARGILYFSYVEASASFQLPSATLLYHIESERWYTMREGGDSPLGGFSSLFYQEPNLLAAQSGLVTVLDQQGVYSDVGTPIPLTFQSGYDNQNEPDLDKNYTELVIEYELNGDAVTVMTYYDSGASGGAIDSLTLSGGKKTSNFALGPLVNGVHQGVQASNISVRLECGAMNSVVIHGIYVYYYTLPRLGTSVAMIPLDFGTGKLKQVKELQLDIENLSGPATATFTSDLPGNALASRFAPNVPTGTTRRMAQLPIGAALVEGRLFQLQITSGNPFRAYSARALMRVVGVYVEAYESAAGFIWDSQGQDFVHLTNAQLPVTRLARRENSIKRARELELEIETGGDVNAALLTDLPGNNQVARFTQAVNASSRRFVRVPLPPNIEGRILRLQLSGSAWYKLYGARVEFLPIGVYIEAYEAAAGAVWDSRGQDFGSPKLKEGREIELDLETSGPINMSMFTDVPGMQMANRSTQTIQTTGRQKVNLWLGPTEGRLMQMVLAAGANAFRLYDARIKVRAIGTYIDAAQAARGVIWDSTESDQGSQKVKQYRELELELWTYGPVAVFFYTDQPGNQMISRFSTTIDTSAFGRQKIQIPLPQSFDYTAGRMLRTTIGGGAFKLFKARVQQRVVGTYVEAYEGQKGATWDSTPLNLGVDRDKVFDQTRFEMSSDGPVFMTVYTDLPGEALAQRYATTVTRAGQGRGWVTVPLPANLEGRLFRVVLSSLQNYTLYQGQVAARAIGRYLAANVNDAYRTLDVDFATERVKLYKKFEVDIQSDGPVTFTMYTDSASVFSAAINTSGVRRTVKLTLPPNVRGRLARVEIGYGNSARLYNLRAWWRPLNEPQAAWQWGSFPVEESAVLPEWSNLPVEPTSAGWEWADIPGVEPTPEEFTWQPWTVEPTPPNWSWADFPVEGTPDEFTWVDIPIGMIA